MPDVTIVKEVSITILNMWLFLKVFTDWSGLSISSLWRCYWYMTLIARKASPFVKMESHSAGCPKKDLGTELSTAEQGFA